MLKARPEMVNDWAAKLWSRFFCLSVYITMYLNDHQRDAFYSSLGLNTTQFNQHGEQQRVPINQIHRRMARHGHFGE